MPTVLIVDDSAVNLKIISSFLDKDYDILLASDGRSAIQIASEQLPDIILLDVLMPSMDGLTTCKYLKKLPETVDIPVIFITVISEPKDIVRAFEAGAQDYITKPFCGMELCARVKNHLELRYSKQVLKEYASRLEMKNNELNQMLSKLELLSNTDYLTDLSNRRHMVQRMEAETAARRLKQGCLSLIMADVNGFKTFNDSYGHDCGDLVLKHIAAILKASVGEHDLVSRWGGDEFLIMLVDKGSEEGRLTAEKINEKARETAISYSGTSFTMQLALGISQYDWSLDLDANIKKADEALYLAKKEL